MKDRVLKKAPTQWVLSIVFDLRSAWSCGSNEPRNEEDEEEDTYVRRYPCPLKRTRRFLKWRPSFVVSFLGRH